MLVGNAEIELHRIQCETAELHDPWIVEAKALAQFLALLQSGLDTNQLVDRIANKLKQSEGHQRHHEHDGDGLHQAADDECDHVGPVAK